MILGVDRFTVGVAGAVGDPGTFGSVEHRFESGNQATGRNDYFHRAVVVTANMYVGLAIGDDKERLVLQFIAQADAQAFGGPQRNVGIAQARFFLGTCARGVEVACEVSDFMMQLIEKFALWQGRSGMRLPGAQSSQPLCRAGEWTRQRPANENQRKTGDE